MSKEMRLDRLVGMRSTCLIMEAQISSSDRMTVNKTLNQICRNSWAVSVPLASFGETKTIYVFSNSDDLAMMRLTCSFPAIRVFMIPANLVFRITTVDGEDLCM